MKFCLAFIPVVCKFDGSICILHNTFVVLFSTETFITKEKCPQKILKNFSLIESSTVTVKYTIRLFGHCTGTLVS